MRVRFEQLELFQTNPQVAAGLEIREVDPNQSGLWVVCELNVHMGLLRYWFVCQRMSVYIRESFWEFAKVFGSS